ncbi:hypothetical protein JHK86_044872 [Glycine max]|nr:hypothetical protein JHK86_044872 [Glycine max]
MILGRLVVFIYVFFSTHVHSIFYAAVSIPFLLSLDSCVKLSEKNLGENIKLSHRSFS